MTHYNELMTKWEVLKTWKKKRLVREFYHAGVMDSNVDQAKAMFWKTKNDMIFWVTELVKVSDQEGLEVLRQMVDKMFHCSLFNMIDQGDYEAMRILGK